MQTMQNNSGFAQSLDSQPTLRLNRPLIPLDIYMARENITAQAIEEYEKLGMIQIRKCRGKAFVVDLPFTPNPYTTEPSQKAPQHSEKEFTNPKSSPLIIKKVFKIEDYTKFSQKTEIQNSKTARAVEKIANRTTSSPAVVKPKKIPAKPLKPIAPKNPHTSALKVAIGTAVREKAIKAPPVEIFHITETAPEENLRTQLNDINRWRTIGLAAIACVLLTVTAAIWLTMDRNLQINRMEHANNVIETAYTNSLKAGHRIQTLENQLVSSETQLTSIENELHQVRQGLKNVQQRNVEAAERLNKQIQKLSDYASNQSTTKP